MHTNRLELKEVYERVLNSRSPLDEFGKIVIENYGLWRCCRNHGSGPE